VILTQTLTIFFLIFFISCYNFILLPSVKETNNLSSANISEDSTNLSNFNNTSSSTLPLKSNNFIIKVGQGNFSVSFNQYYPSNIEIIKGDSITWYNGLSVPLPHSVTFLAGLDNMEKIGIPFYVQNSTKFVPVINNLGEPLEETTKNGTKIVMLLNSRALNPTVITNDQKVLRLEIDSTYIFQGDEKFVNSGPLLSLDKRQNFDYSFSNSFTLIFNKPGLYEYSCLFHPWMIGKVLVKPV
jgi:plastocyanin